MITLCRPGTQQLMLAMGKRYENKTPEQLARELVDMGMISVYEFLLIVRDGFDLIQGDRL
jgi:hypothetical protein